MKKSKSTSEWDNPRNSPILSRKPGVGSREYPSKSKIESAGHEMKANPPRQLAETAKKFGRARARKQKVAMMLAKARKGK